MITAEDFQNWLSYQSTTTRVLVVILSTMILAIITTLVFMAVQ